MSHTAFATICHKIEVCHSKRWIFTEEIGLKTPYLHTNRITQCDNLNSVKKAICKFQKTKNINKTSKTKSHREIIFLHFRYMRFIISVLARS